MKEIYIWDVPHVNYNGEVFYVLDGKIFEDVDDSEGLTIG